MAIERRVLPEYAEELLGLPYPVMIHGAAIAKVDTETGEVLGIAVPDSEGLAAAVAMTRCLLPVQLAAEEIRFMREVIGLRSGEMAAAIDVDPSTYSRYESGAQGVGECVERALRIYVCASLAEKVAIPFDARKLTGMRVTRRSSDTPWPEMTFGRIRMKVMGAGHSEIQNQWEPELKAA